MSSSAPVDYCKSSSLASLIPRLLTMSRCRTGNLLHSNTPTNPRCLQTVHPPSPPISFKHQLTPTQQSSTKNPPRSRPLQLPRASRTNSQIPTHKRRLLHPLGALPPQRLRLRTHLPRIRLRCLDSINSIRFRRRYPRPWSSGFYIWWVPME
jgi:hypothetical protein